MLTFASQLQAQNGNRNLVKFAGIYIDNVTKGPIDYNDFFIGNKYGFAFGYERYLGSHIGLNVTFHKFFGLSNYDIDDINSSASLDGSFDERAYSISYESRYYFEELDEDGGNSLFLGIVVQHNRIKQAVSNASITSNTTGTPQQYNIPDYEVQNNYNRVGLRIGRQLTDFLSNELYFAIYYNFIPTLSKQPITHPTSIPQLSFGITYLLSVPF